MFWGSGKSSRGGKEKAMAKSGPGGGAGVTLFVPVPPFICAKDVLQLIGLERDSLIKNKSCR